MIPISQSPSIIRLVTKYIFTKLNVININIFYKFSQILDELTENRNRIISFFSEGRIASSFI